MFGSKLSVKPDIAYIRNRENECEIVRWRFGGFAFSDQANIKIYSAMDGVKKVPLLLYLKNS